MIGCTNIGRGALIALSLLAPRALVRSAAAAEGDSWWKDVKISGYGELGGLANATDSSASDHLNWGHLFSDKGNKVEINQILLSLSARSTPRRTMISVSDSKACTDPMPATLIS